MIDELPKKYKVGMKQIGRKGKGQSRKKKGGKVIIFKIVKLINKLIKLKLSNHQGIYRSNTYSHKYVLIPQYVFMRIHTKLQKCYKLKLNVQIYSLILFLN